MAHNPASPYCRFGNQSLGPSESSWEDEETICCQLSPDTVTPRPISTATVSPIVHRLRQVKSRHRQKAQNARAGIKLVTNLSLYRRSRASPQTRLPAVYANPTALSALEGVPMSALSPEDRPIIIGISPGTLAPEVHPHLKSPFSPKGSSTRNQRSVWSPDTPSTVSPMSAASSVYSQASHLPATAFFSPGKVLPVPILSAGMPHISPHISPYQGGTSRVQPVVRAAQITATLDDDDDDDGDDDGDDGGSPFTLFEEDADCHVAADKDDRAAAVTTPASASSTGAWSPTWWLQSTNSTPHLKANRETAGTEWWNASPRAIVPPRHIADAVAVSSRAAIPVIHTAPALRVPTPHRTPYPAASQVARLYNPSIPIRPNASLPSRTHPILRLPSQADLESGPPSPSPISPGYTSSMASSQRAIDMSAIPAPLRPFRSVIGSPIFAAGPTPQFVPTAPLVPLPDRDLGTFIPREHAIPAVGRSHKVERVRRRHEKEDFIAHRMDRFWTDRACLPDCCGCFGRAGPEGRRRRRIGLYVVVAVLLAIIVAIILAVMLPRHRQPVTGAPTSTTTSSSPTPASASTAPSASATRDVFLTVDNFPPIPTGVLTVVGPNNPTNVDGCTNPTTVWSCSLPPEQQAAAAPFKPNQPSFVFQIQFDDSASQSRRKVSTSVSSATTTSTSSPAEISASSVEPTAPSVNVANMMTARSISFAPNPAPPSLAEVSFLGSTTDGIVSANKAGEPTPFYLSVLSPPQNTVGPNERRQLQTRQAENFLTILPPPDLNPDGSGAAAVFLPRPQQQPLRLFDRGLATEHYAFYAYFKRTIYVSSVGQNLVTPPAADVPGGSTEATAGFLVTWGSVRYRIALWTRANSTTTLLSSGPSLSSPMAVGNNGGSDGGSTAPGTMPLPITVSIDTHGGDPTSKFVWHHNVAANQHIDTTHPGLLPNNMDFDGSLINPSQNVSDLSLGGVDGGTGGCRCQWTNFDISS